MACCEVTPRIVRGERFDLTIALAGNANVGKSVIFNALTGMNQIIGNWPGKTVELAEGSFDYKGKHIRVVDLPGIYSLSTYSQEEVVSREFIAEARPDVVVNVVDSTVLERNLYFTLQLRELGAPLVTAAFEKGQEFVFGTFVGVGVHGLALNGAAPRHSLIRH